MLKRILLVLLALCLLPACALADWNEKYKSELMQLNAYLQTGGENSSVDISDVYDQFEANGRIGEYTMEFGIYAKALKLLEEGNYEEALLEASELNTNVSFAGFRAYLEDGEELMNHDLYALDPTQMLYDYTMGRQFEAKGNWSKAAEAYDNCVKFMDAMDRKKAALSVTVMPEPTATSSPIMEPTAMPVAQYDLKPVMDSNGLYRLLPRINGSYSKEEIEQVLTEVYGFDDVENYYEGDYGYAYSIRDNTNVFGIDIELIDVIVGGDWAWFEEHVLLNGDTQSFETVRDHLFECLGEPDFGIVELYEKGEYAQIYNDVEGAHELHHLSKHGLLNGTIDSILSECEINDCAEGKTIAIFWRNVCLSYSKEGYDTNVRLGFDSDVHYDYYEDVMTWPVSENASSTVPSAYSRDPQEYLSTHWKYDKTIVVRGWGNDVGYVKRIQAALNNAGYDSGVEDGEFGKQNQAALMQWQKDHMISGSAGLCTPLTGIRLFSENAESYRGTALSSKTISMTPIVSSFKIDRGEDKLTGQLQNTSDSTIVAYSVQYVAMNSKGKNLFDSTRWRYFTGAAWIEPGESAEFSVILDDLAGKTKSVAIYVAEVQYADGTIISNYITGDLLGSGLETTLKL